MSDLSAKSLQSYMSCLNRIKNKLMNDSDDCFLDAAKVVEWIEGQQYSLNTKKLYYIALVAILSRKGEDKWAKCIEAYRTKMNSYNEQQQNIYENQEMNEKEKAKYCTWDEILEVRQTLYGLVEDYWTYQDYMILCLYTMIPPLRLDFADMRVFEGKVDPEYKGNYLLYGKKKSVFVLQEYKTSAKYGKLEIPVSKELQGVLKYWRDTFATDAQYLLFSRYGEPMNESCLGNAVRNLFMKHKNKPTGICMIRHAFVNKERSGESLLKKQQETAKLMAHSLGMNVLYRRV